MRITRTCDSLATYDGQLVHETDRRAATRVQTVFRVGRVVSGDDEGLVRIKNISDQGAQLRLRIPVTSGDALTLELAPGLNLQGHVVWTRGEECGLQFDQAIDCAQVLTRLAASSHHGDSRPVRLPVAATAVTRGENGLRLTEIKDISQRGMKLGHDGSLSAGLLLQITLPSGLCRRGIVRWSRDGVAGIMLLEPFSLEELGSARNL